MADSSVPALKRAFLAAQVRILNTPLRPTDDWREQAGEAPEEGDLDDKVVNGVTTKVNTLLKQHNNSAFPAPALAHVAAQIDALYWANSEPLLGERSLQEGEIDRNADLTNDDIIDSLPESWPSDDEETDPSPAQSSRNRKSTASRPSGLESFAEGARYKQLHNRLVALQERRRVNRKKIAQAQRLQKLLEPLKSPGETVQGNLVTRDGDMGKELERMVMLSARLGGKMSEGA